MRYIRTFYDCLLIFMNFFSLSFIENDTRIIQRSIFITFIHYTFISFYPVKTNVLKYNSNFFFLFLFLTRYICTYIYIAFYHVKIRTNIPMPACKTRRHGYISRFSGSISTNVLQLSESRRQNYKEQLARFDEPGVWLTDSSAINCRREEHPVWQIDKTMNSRNVTILYTLVARSGGLFLFPSSPSFIHHLRGMETKRCVARLPPPPPPIVKRFLEIQTDSYE